MRTDRPTFAVVSLASVLCVIAGSASAQSAADCNADGIPDSQQFGDDFSVWAATTPDGSGVVWPIPQADPPWCPTVPILSSRVVFDHTQGAGVGHLLVSGVGNAGSMWFIGGSWHVIGASPESQIRINAAAVPTVEALRVVGEVTWACPWSRADGLAFVGRGGKAGALSVIGGTRLELWGNLHVGSDSQGTVTVDGGAELDFWEAHVGAVDQSSSTAGLIRVGPGGRVGVSGVGIVFVNDVAWIDGYSGVPIVGGRVWSDSGPILRGSGTVSMIKTYIMTVEPTFGMGFDGVEDSRLSVQGGFYMADPSTGLSGVLQIRPMATGAGPVVPSVNLESNLTGAAQIAGVLRVIFSGPTSEGITQAPIVTAGGAIIGNFDVLQPVGLSTGKTLRVIKSADQTELLLSVVPSSPTPSFPPFPHHSLLRIATDCAFGDFDGDGDRDVAVALAQNSQGNSAVRFYRYQAGDLTEMGTTEFVGQAAKLTSMAIPGTTHAGVAVTDSAGDRVYILRNLGGWMFEQRSIGLPSGSNPAGIASGAFVLGAQGPNTELAIGCPGIDAALVIGPNAAGGFDVLAVIDGVGGDVVRTANIDGMGNQDFATTDYEDSDLHAVSSISSSPVVQRMPLLAPPTALCVANFGGAGARDSLVATMEGASADPASPFANLCLFRPGVSGYSVPARLVAGSSARSISAGDLDGDGRVDLTVVTNVDGVDRIQAMMNSSDAATPTGPLTFIEGGYFHGLTNPRILWGADVNGDGKAEVLSLSAGPSGTTLGPEWTTGLGGAGGPSCTAGDLDCDGNVDGGDLANMLGSWGACGGCAADIDTSGMVDGLDLALLLGNWG